MTDYSELKRLAEAATAGPWVSGGNWVSTVRGNSVADCPRGDEEFIAAANPAAVLALIAENEALRKDAERYRWLRDGAGYCDTRDIPGMAPARMDDFIDQAMSKEG